MSQSIDNQFNMNKNKVECHWGKYCTSKDCKIHNPKCVVTEKPKKVVEKDRDPRPRRTVVKYREYETPDLMRSIKDEIYDMSFDVATAPAKTIGGVGGVMSSILTAISFL